MPADVGDTAAPTAGLMTPEDLDRLYAESPDPWDYSGSWHERRKREVMVASLSRQRYRRCYEPGCSTGELTKLLAPRCDALLAVDCAAAAVQRAQQATQGFEHVRVERAVLPAQLPDQSFDLIVLSELLYYFAYQDVPGLIADLLELLQPGGDIVAVHMQGGESSAGADLHRFLFAHQHLVPLVRHEDERFVLDLLRERQG